MSVSQRPRTLATQPLPTLAWHLTALLVQPDRDYSATSPSTPWEQRCAERLVADLADG